MTTKLQAVSPTTRGTEFRLAIHRSHESLFPWNERSSKDHTIENAAGKSFSWNEDMAGRTGQHRMGNPLSVRETAFKESTAEVLQMSPPRTTLFAGYNVKKHPEFDATGVIMTEATERLLFINELISNTLWVVGVGAVLIGALSFYYYWSTK
jgi:hypothetical protein